MSRVHLASLFCAVLVVLGLPATAQIHGEDGGSTLFGGDRYIAGRSVTAQETTERDLFIAGERASVAAAVAGSVHIAGRRLAVSAPVGGNVYGAGYALRVEAPVDGSVTASGMEILIAAPVTGNLRASGWEVRLDAPVAGSALLAGSIVTLDAEVAGDLSVSAEDLHFGDAAEVGGMLTIYAEDPEAITVPERVAPAARVTVLEAETWEHADAPWQARPDRGLLSVLGGFVLWVLGLAGLAVGLAALMPDRLRALRERAVEHPGQSLVSGFLGLSTLVGAGLVASLTLIGIVLFPAAVVLAGLAMIVGYVLGVYVFGGALWSALGRAAPDTLGQKALMALLGALAAALIGLIPFLGWLFGLVLGMVGFGAILRDWRARRQVSY